MIKNLDIVVGEVMSHCNYRCRFFLFPLQLGHFNRCTGFFEVIYSPFRCQLDNEKLLLLVKMKNLQFMENSVLIKKITEAQLVDISLLRLSNSNLKN